MGYRIKTLLVHRGLGTYGELVAALTSVSKDRKFIDKRQYWMESIRLNLPLLSYRKISLEENGHKGYGKW